MADTIADRLRSLLGSDLYTEKGRLRADDLLVRERACQSLGDAAARLRELCGQWRAERVPPSTREQPFPPAPVMEPLRRADRHGRALEDTATEIRGLPLLAQDKVWARVRAAGLDELLQFDWTLVGESDALARDMAQETALDQVDVPGYESRVRKIRDIAGERQRFIEIS